MSEWRKAEDAPYGTNVLAWIYLPKNPVASGYAIAQRCFVGMDEPESYGEWRMTVGCWWANGRHYHAPGKEKTDRGYITHWMPLPDPPEDVP